jgi:16S rRNA C967 or C1407 C5-methylase (RsmB/RsmF family)
MEPSLGKKKNKGKSREKAKGSEGFETHYAELYGERWPALKAALLLPARKTARRNIFSKRSAEPEAQSFADENGIHDFYFMDPASIFPAENLMDGICDGERVLDLCAAPGGKSLILASHLAETSRLVVNELSDKRRGRLKAVLHDYLPAEILSRVQVTGHDGTKWCLYETDSFDRILIDAPCSGERHLLSDAAEIGEWSTARSRNLSVRQYALLASSIAVVKPGGRIVYSTCSISPRENDDVVARLLKKKSGEVKLRSLHFETGEATEFGWMFLPDRSGIGPIYFSSLERIRL